MRNAKNGNGEKYGNQGRWVMMPEAEADNSLSFFFHDRTIERRPQIEQNNNKAHPTASKLRARNECIRHPTGTSSRKPQAGEQLTNAAGLCPLSHLRERPERRKEGGNELQHMKQSR